MIKLDNVQVQIDKTEIIKNITGEISEKSFVGIIGPNGSGKSTLLKGLYGVHKDVCGTIEINKNSLKSYSGKERGKLISVLSQEGEVYSEFTAEEVVEMGRYPHKSFFQDYNEEDEEIVLKSLEKVGMKEKRMRFYSSLSGGEKQRVLLARALAQETEILILDEPTNHLDIRYQLQLLDEIKGLNKTVVAAIHDLNLAAMYCDELMVMKDGRLILQGKTEDILTEEMIWDVFSIRTLVERHPKTGQLLVIYLK